ncbi:zinc finger CCCH domain-containing protein 7B-like isoform 2-T2 [Odontesthes bonariensis]|uniref:zinc finger CCCH domain-containing protein 7B-like isoform X2 n=1 Tax=Odontesthes bonariensis TaxID=219752 RepID=UPI003F5878DB
MDPVREKRKGDIRKALAFIQSPLAYPDPEGYQDYLTQLVCDLLEEGNACFRDRQWEQAVREFSEGLNVSTYAEGEDIQIPEVLLESLYVNRAAAYHSTGKYDQGVEDCNCALEVCRDSRRALYRKALCLKELGKYKDAYSCTTSCLLSSPQDKQVNELAQELAVHLGLKIRKPYVSSMAPGDHLRNGANPLSVVAPVSFPSVPTSTFASPPPVGSQPAGYMPLDSREAVEDSELMGDDLDSLLDCIPTEQVPAELPPAFFSSTITQLNSLDSFSSDGRSASAAKLDILDDLSSSGTGGDTGGSTLAQTSAALDGLDSLDTLDAVLDAMPTAVATEKVNEPPAELDVGEKSLDELLDEVDAVGAVSHPIGQNGGVPKISTKVTEKLDCLDALDSFPAEAGVDGALPAVSFGGTGLDSLSDFSSNGFSNSHTVAAPPVMRAPKSHCKERNTYGPLGVSNPLWSTHEFLQACATCFHQEGQGIYSFVHKPDLVHNCKRDVLLCRRKTGFPSEWTRVRPLPTWTSFSGPFVLCKELLKSGDLGICKYGEKCSFAYNQLEIDVWTEERKGTLDRTLLFEMAAVKLDPVNGIIRLLQENRGLFIFLCRECYDNKPRIISKRSSNNHAVCSNLDARHNFDANKCLAFVVRTHIVNYSKVRPLSVLCHLDICRQAIRYGCQREDDCQYAHSVIELKTWRVQRHTGISPDEIVKVSMGYYEKQEQISSQERVNRLSSGGVASKSKGGGGVGGSVGRSLNMKMKFACAQCWRDGLISEPDKGLKHCTAKARHMWTKERRFLLVKSPERSKWVQVRPLPHAKNFPLQYDMCVQILEKRKCSYPGNCTFAHSQEEKEMWMYMKNNDLHEMQQIYDMWLALAAHNQRAEGGMYSQSNPEEKYIAMPTDYAELMSGFHCRLCCKHSNSERQWQQHISSEKHKDRVFSCEGEDEALTWSYRFPGTCFKLCPKYDGGCPDGVSCDYAHSPEELQEWTERRDFLRRRLAKAREDMLIMPDELDFGKYNFLLQD